jgi:hypothetical protein
MYAVYAVKFGWTPQQVDEIPYEVESWLLPVVGLIDEVAEEKRKANGN